MAGVWLSPAVLHPAAHAEVAATSGRPQQCWAPALDFDRSVRWKRHGDPAIADRLCPSPRAVFRRYRPLRAVGNVPGGAPGYIYDSGSSIALVPSPHPSACRCFTWIGSLADGWRVAAFLVDCSAEAVAQYVIRRWKLPSPHRCVTPRRVPPRIPRCRQVGPRFGTEVAAPDQGRTSLT